MIKIRLMRIGSKKRPFYRIVAVDERKKRTGGYLDLLGTYNPLSNPKEININQHKIEEWVKKGAIMSDGYLRIIGQAPQHPARPPKKAHPEAKVQASTPADTQPANEDVSQTPIPADNNSEEKTVAGQDIVDKTENADTSQPESTKFATEEEK